MQGMVPGTVVLTCEPCLAFLRMPSGSFRAGILGRMAPVSPQCTGRRRVVSWLPASPGRRVGVAVGRPEAEANAPIWWTRGAMKRVPLPWDHIVVIAYPSFVEDVSLFLDRSGCRMSTSGSVPEG